MASSRSCTWPASRMSQGSSARRSTTASIMSRRRSLRQRARAPACAASYSCRRCGRRAAHAAPGILTERDEPRPTEPYGISKLKAEAAVRSSQAAWTILRPAIIYGPGVKGNLASLLRIAATPWPPPFARFTNRRSLLALENLVAAIELALAEDACVRETFLVADPHALTLAEIVTALRVGAGRCAGAAFRSAVNLRDRSQGNRPLRHLGAPWRQPRGRSVEADRRRLASRPGHGLRSRPHGGCASRPRLADLAPQLCDFVRKLCACAFGSSSS